MDSLNRQRRRKRRRLPEPASPQTLLCGRQMESELGIDVMTILECVRGMRVRRNLWITDGRVYVSRNRSFLDYSPHVSGIMPAQKVDLKLPPTYLHLNLNSSAEDYELKDCKQKGNGSSPCL